MIIIKRGTIPAERIYEATCRVCNTEVSFLQKEAKINYDQRDGNYLTIKCPVCESVIFKDL